MGLSKKGTEETKVNFRKISQREMESIKSADPQDILKESFPYIYWRVEETNVDNEAEKEVRDSDSGFRTEANLAHDLISRRDLFDGGMDFEDEDELVHVTLGEGKSHHHECPLRRTAHGERFYSCGDVSRIKGSASSDLNESCSHSSHCSHSTSNEDSSHKESTFHSCTSNDKEISLSTLDLDAKSDQGSAFLNGEDEESSYTDSFRHLSPLKFDHLDPIDEGKRERLYKVLVVGELGTGKTSMIKRYVHQFFSQHYRATIGVDFALKVLRWDPDTVVRLQLWDIAGQERFGSMTRVYYKEAVGAFVVFDVTRSATLEAVPKWKADLDAKVVLPDGRSIPTVLLANKSDQPKEGIAANREKMNEFCQQQGFSAWFETSAKENINIDESANFLVSKILEMDRWSHEPISQDPEKVELNSAGKAQGSNGCSC